MRVEVWADRMEQSCFRKQLSLGVNLKFPITIQNYSGLRHLFKKSETKKT